MHKSMKFKSVKLIVLVMGLIFIFCENSNVLGQRKNKSKSKIKIVAQQKNNNERRKEVESLLLDGKYQHDGSGELIYIGTLESVPALLKVLEDNPPRIYEPCKGDFDVPPPPPLKNGSVIIFEPPKEESKKDCAQKKTYICTYFHALSALRKITGEKFIELEDWKNWWNEYSKNKQNLKQLR